MKLKYKEVNKIIAIWDDTIYYLFIVKNNTDMKVRYTPIFL